MTGEIRYPPAVQSFVLVDCSFQIQRTRLFLRASKVKANYV